MNQSEHEQGQGEGEPVENITRDQAQAQSELEDTEASRVQSPPVDAAKRALVVVAHPDDAEFGSAGTVTTWTQDGWEVHFLIVTDASGGGDDNATDVSPEARQAIADIRKAEQRAAAEVLGVASVTFLDYPDGRIEATLELRRDIVRVMRRVRPAVVVSPSPERRWDPFFIGRHHPDHLAVGEATIAACYPAVRNAWDFPELLDEGLLPHRVRELWVVGGPMVNHHVDISSTIDAKIEALRKHDSQLGAHFSEVEQSVRRGSAMIGSRYSVKAAEEFYRAIIG